MDVQCGDHGTCIDGLDTYTCQCDPGFSGALCDTHTLSKINMNNISIVLNQRVLNRWSKLSEQKLSFFSKVKI